MREKQADRIGLIEGLSLQPRARALLSALVLAGILALVFAAMSGEGARGWQIVLVNFLFWSGLAQAGIVLSAIFRLTGARWAAPLHAPAAAGAGFLPISLLVLLALFLAGDPFFPWRRAALGEKAIWLNPPFLFARDLGGLALLYGLSLIYVYRSVKRFDSSSTRLLAPAVAIAYPLVFSLVAFDLVMALDPHWSSALFGGYFFVGNLYLGLAALAVSAIALRRRMGLEHEITADSLHDLGKLIFGFSMLWGYLFWSQFLVIWYGNLPKETGYVIKRLYDMPWAAVSWAVLAFCFLVPFILLLSRETKRRPARLFGVSLIIIFGLWLERYLLVIPSLWDQGLPLGWIEVLITAGFFALYMLCFLAFLAPTGTRQGAFRGAAYE